MTASQTTARPHPAAADCIEAMPYATIGFAAVDPIRAVEDNAARAWAQLKNSAA